MPAASLAQQDQFDSCVLELLRQPDNDHLTALQLKQSCTSDRQPDGPATAFSPAINAESRQAETGTRAEQARFSAFFEPYKETYFLAGAMNGDDGYQPFSGQTADIKFALGMKFRLFPDLPAFEKLAPLYFGYGQESWWDIAESSAPFREHNYNPEIFWDYSKTSNRNGFNFIGQFVDQLGFEHQSNGRDGAASRSWDRLYLQRRIQVSDRLDFGIKAWKDVNNGDFNKDITDYLGNLKLSASYQANDRLVVSVDAQQGWETSKLSYQLDFIYRIPEWVNSQFVLSYYEGYGEALISYNRKTSSLRAGLFFPISFNGN
jgi:phospholipase A1